MALRAWVSRMPVSEEDLGEYWALRRGSGGLADGIRRECLIILFLELGR